MREERFAGVTKYPLRKMISFAADGITSFSHKPLKIASYIGVTLSISSFVYLFVVLIQKWLELGTVPGWASIVAINLFFNGIVLMLLGVMGEYIGRIYDESKERPLYIVREAMGYHSRDNHSIESAYASEEMRDQIEGYAG
ncbi:putative glycosyltransferase CsbB [compost metagenome]